MASPRSLLKGFEKTVADSKPDPNKRLTISDPDTRGLYLRVTPAGQKTYTIVARDPARKQVWAAVGDVDSLTLEDARTLAREGVKRIKAGQAAFPRAEPQALPDSFRDVHDNFIKRHVEKKELRTAPETKRIFDKYVLPEWGKRAFAEIRRGDVTKLLDKIEDSKAGAGGDMGGVVMADRVLAALSKLFNWYASRVDDYSSPIVRGMRRSDGRARAKKRILADDEIRLIWKVAGEGGTFGAFVQTCLLTAQRRAKVATMKWDDITDGKWTIPSEDREKSNAGELQLSKEALTIIEARPRLSRNPHVFAGRGDKALAGFSPMKREFDAALAKANGGKPLEGWTVHDLRRTAKSLMARAGVRPDVSERVLGHVITGVEGVYDRHDYSDEKGDALRKLAGLVEAIVNPPKGNVTKFRNRAA
jgi:integrase